VGYFTFCIQNKQKLILYNKNGKITKMKRLRSSHLKWPNLLLIGILVFVSFSLRPEISQPVHEVEKEKIGFIGDSITHGPKQGVSAVEAEMTNLGFNYTAINRGASGTTSVDWQPGTILFDDALAVFKTQNVHTVSIMLGTNDARHDRATSPAMYRRNMERIIENLLASGVVTQVIVNYPPYVVPGALKLWDASSTVRLKLYAAQLDEIVKERGVAKGDTRAFGYFQQRPYQLIDGVHPNSLGVEALGKLWADAYKKVVALEAAKRQVSALSTPSHDRI
jgi:lysophospholipase L1-like esterase